MSEDKQQEKITLQVIPETEREIFSLDIPKSWLKWGLYIIILSVVLLAGVLYYYYYQFHITRKEVKLLVPYRQKAEKLEEKNKDLQSKLSNLSQQTEEIKEQFNQIKKENKQVKEMIDFNNDDDISSNTNDDNNSNDNQLPQATTASTSIGSSNTSGTLIKNTKHNLSILDEGIDRKKKDLSDLKEEITNYKDYLAAKPKGWPLLGGKGKISSGYGDRFHPIKKKRIFHEGVDIGVWYNHKVVATGKAKVVFSGWKSGYGRTVILEHGYGYRTLYGHNNKVLVKKGEVVKRGEAIALSGNSGQSTGPHLHYEVHVNGEHTNPQPFF
ncbi:MAG: peptidoglycan DD-metalloendopeptidase family protein [Bacillota bacterium]